MCKGGPADLGVGLAFVYLEVGDADAAELRGERAGSFLPPVVWLDSGSDLEYRLGGHGGWVSMGQRGVRC